MTYGEESTEIRDLVVSLFRPAGLPFIITPVPYKRFAKLQDEFLAVFKQMRDAKNPEEKMKLLKELQSILKESQRVLEEIDKK